MTAPHDQPGQPPEPAPATISGAGVLLRAVGFMIILPGLVALLVHLFL